jgi:hypothetical protein
VKLNAGTFNLNGGIVFSGKSGVTLRGAGPDQTQLVFTGETGCMVGGTDVCITAGNGMYPLNPDGSANWTGGYAKGTTSISLSNTTGLGPGQLMILDQLNDSDTDNGGVWVCSTTNICSSEGDSNMRRPGRSQSQAVVVTSVSGNTVSFTPGLYASNWRASQSPGAWWSRTPAIQGVGIEDLTLDHTNSPALSGVFVTNARDWWIKNVRGVYSDRATVWVYGATRGTIRDSYFYGTQGAESRSYGIETDLSSDILVENNIFQNMAIPMPTGESVTGGVYLYNFTINNHYESSGNTQWMQASTYHHSGGISYHLFEGNDGTGFTADQIHGTSHFGTLFRNYWAGWEQGKTQQTDAVHIYSFNRYFNVIGNVLGHSGTHTNYECFPASATTASCTTGPSASIYMLGWSANEEKYATMPNDLLVRSTLYRWANYDVVTGVRFNASEVPSNLSQYAQPVPSSQSLPPSLVYTSKPAWWGAGAWPGIGPDVTGGQLMGGRVHKIPARVCFESIMGGTFTSGLLSFNANACYSSAPASGTSAPNPPSNLRILGSQ